MDERTGYLANMDPELIKRFDHLHMVPRSLEEVAKNLINEARSLNKEPAIEMTGKGELSQWRQDLASHRRNKKRKARALHKANKRRGNG